MIPEHLILEIFQNDAEVLAWMFAFESVEIIQLSPTQVLALYFQATGFSESFLDSSFLYKILK